VDYADVLRALEREGARFAVAGGFACLAHGVVRVTMDLDLLVDVQDDNLSILWETLSRLGFMTQQPIVRQDAVSAATLLRLAREKGMQALSWVHGTQPFLIVDLLVGEPFHWSEEVLRKIPLFGVETRVLSREELIRLKKLAGRSKDLVDVQELERRT
jgi:hypothetical protein